MFFVSRTMKTEQIILNLLLKSENPIHQKRANILAKMVASAVANPQAIYLTNLGRNLNINAHMKHKIKTADRLIGNKKLHQEKEGIYRMLASTLLKDIKHPIILIDWSPLCKNQDKQLLRAAIALNGKRSIAIYEQVHSGEFLANREIQERFLQLLKVKILPKNCQPIIIADSGFRVPFLKHVEFFGWHWIGRIRNRDFIAKAQQNQYFPAKDLYAQATEKAENLGEIYWTKKSKFSCQLFLYHKPPKGRIDANLKGQRRKAKASRKNASRESEPWLIVASNSMQGLTPKDAINYYKTRMQIETGFRDTKSPYYGLGLTDLSRVKPERYEILLLIVALSMLAFWIAGNAIYDKKNC